ncbi:Protein-S-isoprenylcysteine O-methyltransferase [Mycena kentingensis (nom. inval.)]|nr:Protein-S-isoprenylcysteine O-methyltransferase [Mycena kentingensis (nom. inval.)]
MYPTLTRGFAPPAGTVKRRGQGITLLLGREDFGETNYSSYNLRSGLVRTLTMSWIKPFCLVYAMYGVQTAITPPQPPAREQLVSTPLEPLLKQRLGPIIVKCLCWIVATVEIVVLVAKSLPNWRYSAALVSLLSHNERADAIRISPVFVLGIFLTGLGAYLRAWCYRELGAFFTFEVSIRHDHRLVQSGPYAVVRHPGYAGILITLCGLGCWIGCAGSWLRECGALETRLGMLIALSVVSLVACITVGLLLRMSKEDEALQKCFGADWEAYNSRVPFKLIPGVV